MERLRRPLGEGDDVLSQRREERKGGGELLRLLESVIRRNKVRSRNSEFRSY